jgi:hypothetical protein
MSYNNYPHYNETKNHGSAHQDVERAIDESVRTGEPVGLRYCDVAATLLSEWCDWESEEEYDYRGTNGDGAKWQVHLTVRVNDSRGHEE